MAQSRRRQRWFGFDPSVRLILILTVALTATTCAPAPEHKWSVLLVTLDTTRLDHLSVYGYERSTTPTLEKLAQDSLVFVQAFSQNTNTAPSHASMLTGLYPPSHGLLRNDYDLAPEAPLLTETLAQAGFETAAFISGFSMARAGLGLDRGFDIYDRGSSESGRDGGQTVAAALDWLSHLGEDERYFLFVHLFDAHGPYQPPADLAEVFSTPTLESEGARRSPPQRMPEYQILYDEDGQAITDLDTYIDRYDAELRYEDDLVARLLAAVDLDTTVVVILADHGETLAERFWGFDHGGEVYEEQIRIPMLLRIPGVPGRTIEDMVETVDLKPTLLRLLDLPVPETLPGRLLWPPGDSNETPRQWIVSSARAEPDRFPDLDFEMDRRRLIYTLRSRQWKLVRYPGLDRDHFALFELGVDSGEEHNLASQYPDKVEAMNRVLAEWLRSTSTVTPSRRHLSEDEERKLQALGYLGD